MVHIHRQGEVTGAVGELEGNAHVYQTIDTNSFSRTEFISFVTLS